MSRKSDGASTAQRVKAFRERLSVGSYKRVEGYITAEEKARIDAVKTEMGVTTDVAVAGLLRMGLEQFEQSRTAAVPQVLFTAEMETYGQQSPVMSQGVGMLAGGIDAQTAVSANLMSFTSANACASLSDSHAVLLNAAPVSVNAAYAAAVDHDNDNNPIARFFKHRKEMNKNE